MERQERVIKNPSIECRRYRFLFRITLKFTGCPKMNFFESTLVALATERQSPISFSSYFILLKNEISA